MSTETGVVDKVITPYDYCDRCVAKAYFLVSLGSGDLYFCGHHFSKYEDALVDLALNIYEHSDPKEEEKPSLLDME
jgi:hypothetical protein